MKTFYSLEDIENLVAQGVRELIVDEDTVLTDVARDAAARLGLKLLPKGRGRRQSQRLPAASAAPTLGAGAGARPRLPAWSPWGAWRLGQAGTASGAKAPGRRLHRAASWTTWSAR